MTANQKQQKINWAAKAFGGNVEIQSKSCSDASNGLFKKSPYDTLAEIKKLCSGQLVLLGQLPGKLG
jgi:hypothetical protein